MRLSLVREGAEVKTINTTLVVPCVSACNARDVMLQGRVRRLGFSCVECLEIGVRGPGNVARTIFVVKLHSHPLDILDGNWIKEKPNASIFHLRTGWQRRAA